MEYVERTITGWGKRIMNSIKGVFFGLILFFGSFWVLWWNEGRTDISEVARKYSIGISAMSIDPSAEGKFVSITGMLTADEKLGDPEFLAPGDYIRLNRISEMYAWEEKSETRTEKKLGGSEELVTTYTYEREWTESPVDSSNFKKPEGHWNPAKSIASRTFHVSSARVGTYGIDPSLIQMPEDKPVPLSTSNIVIPVESLSEVKKSLHTSEGYVFVGRGTLESPQIGDHRIQFRAVPSGVNVTAFGRVEQESLVPYVHGTGNSLYRFFEGTRDMAIQRMAAEHKVTTWILRIVGFFMMWFGLTLFFGPVTTFLDFIPLFGNVSRTMVKFFMFFVSLVLSIITMVISMIVHNLYALMAIAVLLVTGITIWLVKKSKAMRTAQAGAES